MIYCLSSSAGSVDAKISMTPFFFFFINFITFCNSGQTNEVFVPPGPSVEMLNTVGDQYHNSSGIPLASSTTL